MLFHTISATLSHFHTSGLLKCYVLTGLDVYDHCLWYCIASIIKHQQNNTFLNRNNVYLLKLMSNYGNLIVHWYPEPGPKIKSLQLFSYEQSSSL